MSHITPDPHEEIQRLRDELADTKNRLQAVQGASGELIRALEFSPQPPGLSKLGQSPVAISLTRLSDGLYIDVNHQWEKLTGHSHASALGRTSVEMGLWESAAHRDAYLKPVYASGQLHNLDMPCVRPDGVRLILQHNVCPISLNGVDYLLAYLTDVSAERQTQAALLASGQLLKATNNRLNRQVALFESLENLAAVGYWTTDTEQKDLRWSNGLYGLAGLAPGSVGDRVAGRARIHPDDRSVFEQARAALDGSTVQYRWLHPDGRVHWLRTRMRRWQDEGDQAIDFGVVQDITDEREAALALQAQLDFIQQITRRVPGAVFQFRRRSDARHEFLFVSDFVSELYQGVTPQEVLQNPRCLLRPIHPQDRSALMMQLKTSAQDLTPTSMEFRLLDGPEQLRWLRVQAVPEREGDGAVLWSGFTTDITSNKLAQEQLCNSEARFRALTELSSDWYWEQDADFQLTRLEGSQEAFQRLNINSYLGKTRWDSDVQGVSAAQWQAHRVSLLAHETFHDFEFQRPRDDGSLMWVSVSGTPFYDAQGEFQGYRGVGRNISERKWADEKIERLAFYDVLTGLPNRRLLLDRLQQALVLSAREKSIGALLFIDLDNFKDLNDTQGHDVGDLLLQLVARRLLGSVREADTVARLGGDEFVVMLQGLDTELAVATTQVEQVGKKILAQLNQAYPLRNAQYHSTPSIGVTLFEDHSQTLEELLKQADLAMYESKSAGRNTLRFFDPSMQALVAARTVLETELRYGLQRQELLVYYQPIVDCDAVLTGVEALVRWQHPQRGLVSPAEFIPVAEQSGLILPLGHWVLEQACEQLVLWARVDSTQRLTISVNVSARQFRQPDFAKRIQALLLKTGANARRLKLELTESLLLSDVQDAIQKMSELQAVGVGFSLDDFGTGYSSLSYLKQLPLQQLKIDQSFVQEVMTATNDAVIARTVLALGLSMGLSVVAEGVETQAQREFLISHGCLMFQGYLFGRPVPVEALVLNRRVPLH